MTSALYRTFMYVGGGCTRPATLDLFDDGTVAFNGKPNVGNWTMTSTSELRLAFDARGRSDHMKSKIFKPIPNTDAWMYTDPEPRWNVTIIPVRPEDAAPPAESVSKRARSE